MYPPPITTPPGGEGKPKGAVTLNGNPYAEVVAFYTAVFGTFGIQAETVSDPGKPEVTRFEDTLFIRDTGPQAANAEIILYTASAGEVDKAFDAGMSGGGEGVTSPDNITEDGLSRRFASLNDPDGNRVWLVYDAPSLGATA